MLSHVILIIINILYTLYNSLTYIQWTLKVESQWKNRALSNDFLSGVGFVENDHTSPCWPISNRADTIWFPACKNSFSPAMPARPAMRAFLWGQFLISTSILMILWLATRILGTFLLLKYLEIFTPSSRASIFDYFGNVACNPALSGLPHSSKSYFQDGGICCGSSSCGRRGC